MCKIYYPYFRLEVSGFKDKKNKKVYDHNLYLNTLALFCDKILIPTWHLLEMDNDKFDILLKKKLLFQEGIIYSRIPENMNSLEEYYEDAKKKVTDRIPEAVDIRINKIINELYGSTAEFAKFNVIEEQEYYSKELHDFLEEYHERVPNAKGIKELLVLWKSGGIICKEVFEPILLERRCNRKISSESYRKIKKISDQLYFIAGASVQSLKVCSADYFWDKSTASIIKTTIPNIDNIINDKYNPENIIYLLIDLDVIKNREDIEKLSPEEIIKLRKQKCFKKFIECYELYSSSKRVDKIFEKKKNSFKLICILKSMIMATFFTVVSTIIPAKLTQNLLFSIIWAIVFMIITYIGTYLWQTKKRYEIPLFETGLCKIIGFFDPVSLYLAKLHWTIEQI